MTTLTCSSIPASGRFDILARDGFGYWLAGFIDGEGSFQIDFDQRNGRASYRPVFVLKLRDDDEAILAQIVKTTGIGILLRDAKGKGANSQPAIRWVVHSKEGCAALVELIDRFPLRAKKSRDFVIWAEAVRLWMSRRRGYRYLKGDGWAAFEVLRDRLKEVRKYRRARRAAGWDDD